MRKISHPPITTSMERSKKRHKCLTFTWRFTADGMGSAINAVVGDGGPVLRLMNVHCENANLLFT